MIVRIQISSDRIKVATTPQPAKLGLSYGGILAMRGRYSLVALVGVIVAFSCLPACGMSHVSSVRRRDPRSLSEQ